MRKLWINVLAPAMLLAATTVVSSQPPDPNAKPAPTKDKEAPAKSQLEQMLEIALKSNPDLRVADAKAREADAELSRARLAVTRKVVLLYNNLETARANVNVAEKLAKRLRAMSGSGGVAAQDLDEAEAKLVQAKAELAKLEAEIPYLLGQQKLKWRKDADGKLHLVVEASAEEKYQDVFDRIEAARLMQGGGIELRVERREPNKAMSDKLRAALETPMTLEFKSAERFNLDNFLAILRKEHPDILINNKSTTTSLRPITVKAVPLSAVLQWLEDELGDNRIVVRDYGLLIVPNDKIPSGAMLLDDFMKRRDKDAPKTKEEKKTTSP